MTPLYRFAAAQSPDLGRRTVWTMHPESAEWLAAWETGRSRSDGQRYQTADDFVVEDPSQFDVERLMREGRIDAKDLLTHAERTAPVACRWVHFTYQGEIPWKGAILYLGDEPVPAWPTRRSHD